MTATSCYRFRCRWTGKKVLVTFHEFLLKHAPDFSHVPTVAKELVGEDESCWLGRFGDIIELVYINSDEGTNSKSCHVLLVPGIPLVFIEHPVGPRLKKHGTLTQNPCHSVFGGMLIDPTGAENDFLSLSPMMWEIYVGFLK